MIRDTFGIGGIGDNPRVDPIGHGSLEERERETQNDRDPRFVAFRRILEVSLGDGMVSVAPHRFAPRLVAPNHNETCQGAYLREHLKSDFYLLACPSLFFSFFFFFFGSRSRLSHRTVYPRPDITP